MCYFQEKIWLQQLSAGSEKAYKQLFERYYSLLATFAHKYLLDNQLAEDAVHDVLLNLYQQKEKFNSIVLLKSYLYNSVRNRCLNLLEHQKVAREYAAGSMRQENNWKYSFLEAEVYEQLREAIDSLPEQQRKIFDLTLQGYNNGEIAGTLGITEDAVKAHKKRGKKLLREKLQHLMYGCLIIHWLLN